MLLNCLFVGCGGFVGSVLRYLCGCIKVPISDFPFITLGINFIGSFAIMFLAGFFAHSFPVDERTMLFLRVGLCGGFTTFSTFSAETLLMLENGDTLLGIGYAVASCVLCVVAAYLGELAAAALASN